MTEKSWHTQKSIKSLSEDYKAATKILSKKTMKYLKKISKNRKKDISNLKFF